PDRGLQQGVHAERRGGRAGAGDHRGVRAPGERRQGRDLTRRPHGRAAACRHGAANSRDRGGDCGAQRLTALSGGRVINPKALPCDEGTIRATRIVPDCVTHVTPWVLVVTILGSSMAFIDRSVVNVALPAIETELGTSAVVIQWLVNAYTLTLSAFLLIGGAPREPFWGPPGFLVGAPLFSAAPPLSVPP